MKLRTRGHATTTCAALLATSLAAAPAFAGSIGTIYDFAGGPSGYQPVAGPVQDSAGNLYGETNNGGTGLRGVVYKITPSGQETILVNFVGTNGAFGQNKLTLIGNTLFGTAETGGTNNDGVVFSVNTDGTGFTLLHQFTGGRGGEGPIGALLQGPAGVLYGLATGGNGNNDGLLYKLTMSGTYTVLHTFTGGLDGSAPNSIALTASGIIVGSDGSVATPCDRAGCGVVFAENPATGGFGVLATFVQAEGAKPVIGGVTQGNVIYGAAQGGGPGGEGTLFEIVQSGTKFTVNVLYAFNATAGGEEPTPPVLMPNGTLIGTTRGYAGSSYDGTLYSFANGVLTTLYIFTATDSEGWDPTGIPLITPSGTIIGATELGGDPTCAGLTSPDYCGAIYSYTP